jgi:transcription elongation factor GreA
MNTENEVILTASGLKKIEEELEHLRTVHRREVADRIRDSKQFGELSENSEYEDAKTEQAFVEGRILELKRILMNAHVVEDDEIHTDAVSIGSKVTVRDMQTKDEWSFTIVGSVEADPTEDRISNESPVGEALMDKKVGDSVEIEVPEGKAKYKIVKIGK